MLEQSVSAEAVRAAMSQSMDRNAAQVAMTEESRLLLAAMLRDDMRVAVAEGIQAAMTTDAAREFAQIFLAEMRTQATAKVDVWAGGVVRSLLSKIALFLVAGSIVYSIGGWGAIAALVKWIGAEK